MNSMPDGAVCQSPPVFTLSSWAESLAVRIRMLRGLDVPAKLDSWVGLQAWSKLAARHMDQSGRSFQLSAARLARDADRLISQWCVDDEKLWLDETFNAMRWSMHQQMGERGVFSSEDWLTDLMELLGESSCTAPGLPTSISLSGFVELTAIEQRFFKVLQNRGIEIESRKGPVETADVSTLQFPTPEDEWRAAASWAKKCLAGGARRLAIVVDSAISGSGQSARRIRQALAAEFHPWSQASLEVADVSDFHIQAAGYLSDSGVVSDALMLIRISLQGVRAGLDFSVLSNWLLSPCWAGAIEETPRRAWLELQLREAGAYQCSLTDVRRLASSSGFEGELAILLDKITKLPESPRGKGAGTWIHQVLEHWGWPGPESHTQMTREVEAFNALLEKISAMEFTGVGQALETLQVMAAGTPLSFGGGPLSPVQVISPEIAAIGGFDAAWVCHTDETSWPPPIAHNPCLPASAQNVIPRKNPEGQYDYFRKLTRLLSACAQEVVFSWSVDAGQGKRSASALVADYRPQRGDTPLPVHLSARALGMTPGEDGATSHDRLTALEDHTGLPFAGDDEIALPGGSGFFRMQAACPLAAYLRYRLSARFPEAPTLLASPQFRGELLHQALRELYRGTVEDRGKPLADDVPAAVKAAMIRLHASGQMTASAFQAEEQRLVILLREWLQLESDREGFEVDSLEQTFRLRLDSFLLNVRPDRLDRLAGDHFMVIDYKSGGARSRALKWTLPRIQEPQLPLYAVLLEQQGTKGSAGGMAFAIARQGECAFDGICGTPDGGFQGIRIAGQKGRGGLPNWEWPQLMQHWRTQLTMLGREILAGDAQNRVHDADIVRYSGLGLILRHAEAEKLGQGKG